MRRILVILLIVPMLSAGLLPTLHVAAAAMPLVISEVQTGGLTASGAADGRLEFVELYNTSDTTIDVSGWQLLYFGASSDVHGAPTRVLASLGGTVTAGGHVLIASPDFAAVSNAATVDMQFDAASTTTSTSGWLAAGGGYVALVDSAAALYDAVGWGSAKKVDSWWIAPEIPAGSSIQRILPGDAAYTADGVFAAPSSAVTPQGGGLQAPPPPPLPVCDGVVLSEVLPNPAGADTGNEFIEITNPTNEPIDLLGCSLRVGDNGPSFRLPDEQLMPGGYRAFSDTESGLTLPNASASPVWLFTTSGQQSTIYPDAMSDGQSWAFIDGAWQATNQPTPGAANKTSVIPAAADETTATSEPASCPAGKERNPATNRCRTLPVADTSLQACPTGQTRNSQTNRCRAVTSATNAPKPCPAGQQRNLATNRCRKSPAANSTFAKVQDATTHNSGSVWQWWLALLAALGAVGYGMYEWRSEIVKVTRRLYSSKIHHPPG